MYIAISITREADFDIWYTFGGRELIWEISFYSDCQVLVHKTKNTSAKSIWSHCCITINTATIQAVEFPYLERMVWATRGFALYLSLKCKASIFYVQYKLIICLTLSEQGSQNFDLGQGGKGKYKNIQCKSHICMICMTSEPT